MCTASRNEEGVNMRSREQESKARDTRVRDAGVEVDQMSRLDTRVVDAAADGDAASWWTPVLSMLVRM